MSSLYLAANFISVTGYIPGFSGYAHLQIVYGTGPGSLELEVRAPWNATAGDWHFSLAKPHTDTPNYLDSELYKAVKIVDEADGAENIWNILNQINDQYLNSQKINKL